MTMLITVLIGTGSLLIISAIEGKSIQETFQRILRGESATVSSSETFSLSQGPRGRNESALDRGFYTNLEPGNPSYL